MKDHNLEFSFVDCIGLPNIYYWRGFKNNISKPL